jgi:hypothetical protein
MVMYPWGGGSAREGGAGGGRRRKGGRKNGHHFPIWWLSKWRRVRRLRAQLKVVEVVSERIGTVPGDS